MRTKDLHQKCEQYMRVLCEEISERSVGSEGNRRATDFFEQIAASFGWETDTQSFDAVDWEDGGAKLAVQGEDFQVYVSPYSNGCEVEGELAAVSSIDDLERADIREKIVLLYGEIAKEQLMPKKFPFYNPEEHQHIIALLEKGCPTAIIGATGRNAALAGGVYPFPLIEDGDFDIPSIYMTDVEGERLLKQAGKRARLQSNSKRIYGKGTNVTARKGPQKGGRVVVTAHIDAKKGTPGAIDNATGVAILLLLADLLKDADLQGQVELVALNGEDYYGAPGQLLYLAQNQGRFAEIKVNINIDGAGYHEGLSAFSFYNLPADVERDAKEILRQFEGITEGVQWYQGDHSMFLQNGCPAIAVSSSWFTDNVDGQEITHTPKDNLRIVDCQKVVEIAQALAQLIANITA